VRKEADHRRHAEEAGNPGKDVCRKFQAKSKSYLQEVRKAAMVEYR
jgi:hypothetical protein